LYEKNKMKKSVISIVLGILSLLYYPFLLIFGEQIWKIARTYYLERYNLMIAGVIFVLFAILGIIFSIQARKSGEKLLSTIGIVLSFLGLLIVVGFVSFIYLVGRFWGG